MAATHEIPLERGTLHGHFSQDLPAVLTIDPGDRVRFATLDAGWGLEAPSPDGGDRRVFEPRHGELDEGHALVGPIAVPGARAGQVLSVRIDELRVGTYGFTFAGGWDSPENVRLGVEGEPGHALVWQLDAGARTGTDQHGRVVGLRPFLGVLGMLPPEPGVHSTAPPRACGGNIDCADLQVGSTLLSRSRSTRPSSLRGTVTRGRGTARSRASRSNARWRSCS